MFLMVAATNANATIDPEDNHETDDKEQIQSELTATEQDSEQDKANAEIMENEGSSEDDGSISNSSFNYFFYLIYKIKFADVFKLPNRNSESSRSAVPNINLNSLLEKLTDPKI